MRLGGGLVVAVVLVLCAAVSAQPYPPTTGAGRVSRSMVKACQCTVFSGDGFSPGSTVTVTDDGDFVGTATVDAQGEFSLRVCFEEIREQGDHELLGTGTDVGGGGREVRATVTIRGNACFTDDDEIHDNEGRGGSKGGSNGGTGTSRPPASGNGRPLPRTGAAVVVPALLGGFAMVALGCAVVFVSRRRRAALS